MLNTNRCYDHVRLQKSLLRKTYEGYCSWMFYKADVQPTVSKECLYTMRCKLLGGVAANVIPAAAANPLDWWCDSSAFMNRNDLRLSASLYLSACLSVFPSFSLSRLGISLWSLSCWRGVIQAQPCVSLCVNLSR